MRIVVIGAGLAGFSFLENLSASKDAFSSQPLELFLIEKELPSFRRYLFLDWLVEKVPDSEFFIYPDSLKGNFSHIEVINDKATRINFDKKKIFFKEKEPIDFDKLVLSCGAKPQRKEFSGVFKEGVYYLGNCKPWTLKENIKIFDHIIVYVETLLGLLLIDKLSTLSNKEIKVVAQNLDFLPPEKKEQLLAQFKEKGIDIYLSVQISEALGESRTKAVKLSSGKFLACDILILDTLLFPDLDIIKDNPDLLENEAVKVDQYLRTQFESCFACGTMINANLKSEHIYLDNKNLALNQSRIVARNILGLKESYSLTEKSSQIEQDNILGFI